MVSPAQVWPPEEKPRRANQNHRSDRLDASAAARDAERDPGSSTQAILMSIYRTLKLRVHNPLDTIENALRERVRTGQLPDLPQPTSSDG